MAVKISKQIYGQTKKCSQNLIYKQIPSNIRTTTLRLSKV